MIIQRIPFLRLCRGVAAFAAIAALTRADAAEPAPSPQATAAESDYDRVTVRAGGFLLSNVTVTMSLDTLNGEEGDDVSYVEDLGGDDSLTIFRSDAEWRFARNHRVGLAWFDISQSTRHVLDTEINWGGEVFPIDAEVNTDLGVTVSKINYGYGVYSRGRHEVFLLAGVHVTRLEAGISAPDLARSERIGVTAPLPVFGAEWKYAILERLRLQVSYEYFGISLDDRYKGSLSDFLVFLDYGLAEHVSVGAGFNRYVLRASVEGDRLKLSLKHSYDGLMGYVTVHF